MGEAYTVLIAFEVEADSPEEAALEIHREYPEIDIFEVAPTQDVAELLVGGESVDFSELGHTHSAEEEE